MENEYKLLKKQFNKYKYIFLLFFNVDVIKLEKLKIE